MKTPRFILALLALTVALAPQTPKTAFSQPYKRGYSAKLISPRPGQVLSSWTSCEDCMDGGLSRRGPDNV